MIKMTVYVDMSRMNHGADKSNKRVEAVLDSEYGVFGYYVEKRRGEGDLVHLLGGDDGFWWEIASYDEAWMPDIIEVLQAHKPKKRRK